MPYAKRVHLLPRKTIHILAGPPVDLDDLRGQPLDAERARRGHRAGHARHHRAAGAAARRAAPRTRCTTRASTASRRTGNPVARPRDRPTGEGERHDALRRAGHRQLGHGVRAGAGRRRLRGHDVGTPRRADRADHHRAPQRRLPAGRRAAGVDRRHHRRRAGACGTPTSSSSRCRRRPSASTSSRWADLIPRQAAVVSLMKGVELGTTRRMSEVIAEAGKVEPERVVVVSGPEPGAGDRPAPARGQRGGLHRPRHRPTGSRTPARHRRSGPTPAPTSSAPSSAAR